jgi:hypothetical protein
MTSFNNDFLNINFLVKETYLPFASTILDEEIEQIIFNPNAKYWQNKTYIYTYHNKHMFPVKQLFKKNNAKQIHTRKIANIVHDILTNNYSKTYKIPIYVDYDKKSQKCFFDFDDVAMYHIRAFHYCQKNPPIKLIFI